jgi:DNA invertase Pin-like site-specific DNA recombinase
MEGIAAGEHVERSLILDLALALAEDRRRDIARTKNGLKSARSHGRVGGRPTVVDDDKRRAILARRAEGQSLRTIARGVGVSLAVVHRIASEAETSPAPGAAKKTATSSSAARRRAQASAPIWP